LASQTANLSNAFATHAQLPRASTRIRKPSKQKTWCPSPRGALQTTALMSNNALQQACRAAASPVTGSRSTSLFARPRGVRSRFIHKNESASSTSVNGKSARPCTFRWTPAILNQDHTCRILRQEVARQRDAVLILDLTTGRLHYVTVEPGGLHQTLPS